MPNADEEVLFKVRLDDQLSGPTRAMDASLTVLDKQLRRERAELAATEAAMRSLNKATVVDVGSFRALTQQAQLQRTAMNRSLAALHAQGQSAASAAAATRRLADAERAAERSSRALAASAAGAVEKVQGMIGPARLAELALGALSAAFTYAAFKGVGLVAGAADSKREVEATLSLVLDTQSSVEQTYRQLRGISSRLGVSQEATEKVAESLALAGVSGQAELTSAVSAVQTAARVSETAGDKIKSLIERAGASGVFQPKKTAFKGAGVSIAEFTAELARSTGKSIAVLTRELKAGKVSAQEGIAALTNAVHIKLDPVASGLGRTFGASVERLKGSLKSLFDGVDVVPFEKALAHVVDLFDDTTKGGEALKGTLTPVFNSIFRGLTAAVYGAEREILKLEIAFLDLYNTNETFRHEFDDLFPKKTGDRAADLASDTRRLNQNMKTVGETIDKVKRAWRELTSAVGEFESIVQDVISALEEVADAALEIPKAFLVVASNINDAVNVIGESVEDVGSTIWGGLKKWGPRAFGAGADLISGLVDGLKAGTENLVKVVEHIGGRAIAAFRHAFDSHSPSRVTMRIGADVSRGLEIGAERQRPERRLRLVGARSAAAVSVGAREEVVRASSRAPELPRTVSSPQGVGPHGRAGGGHDAPSSVDFSGMQIEINGVEGGEEVPEQLLPLFSDLFERAGLIRGTRPAGSGKAA